MLSEEELNWQRRIVLNSLKGLRDQTKRALKDGKSITPGGEDGFSVQAEHSVLPAGELSPECLVIIGQIANLDYAGKFAIPTDAFELGGRDEELESVALTSLMGIRFCGVPQEFYTTDLGPLSYFFIQQMLDHQPALWRTAAKDPNNPEMMTGIYEAYMGILIEILYGFGDNLTPTSPRDIKVADFDNNQIALLCVVLEDIEALHQKMAELPDPVRNKLQPILQSIDENILGPAFQKNEISGDNLSQKLRSLALKAEASAVNRDEVVISVNGQVTGVQFVPLITKDEAERLERERYLGFAERLRRGYDIFPTIVPGPVSDERQARQIAEATPAINFYKACLLDPDQYRGTMSKEDFIQRLAGRLPQKWYLKVINACLADAKESQWSEESLLNLLDLSYCYYMGRAFIHVDFIKPVFKLIQQSQSRFHSTPAETMDSISTILKLRAPDEPELQGFLAKLVSDARTFQPEMEMFYLSLPAIKVSSMMIEGGLSGIEPIATPMEILKNIHAYATEQKGKGVNIFIERPGLVKSVITCLFFLGGSTNVSHYSQEQIEYHRIPNGILQGDDLFWFTWDPTEIETYIDAFKSVDMPFACAAAPEALIESLRALSIYACLRGTELSDDPLVFPFFSKLPLGTEQRGFGIKELLDRLAVQGVYIPNEKRSALTDFDPIPYVLEAFDDVDRQDMKTMDMQYERVIGYLNWSAAAFFLIELEKEIEKYIATPSDGEAPYQSPHANIHQLVMEITGLEKALQSIPDETEISEVSSVEHGIQDMMPSIFSQRPAELFGVVSVMDSQQRAKLNQLLARIAHNVIPRSNADKMAERFLALNELKASLDTDDDILEVEATKTFRPSKPSSQEGSSDDPDGYLSIVHSVTPTPDSGPNKPTGLHSS